MHLFQGLLAGGLVTGLIVLALGGLAKAIRPAPMGVGRLRWVPPSLPGRALGLLELGFALAGLAIASPAIAWLTALVYSAFTLYLVHKVRRSAGRAECACFGGEARPVSAAHVVVNTAIAFISALAAALGATQLPAFAEPAMVTLSFYALTLAMAILVVATITEAETAFSAWADDETDTADLPAWISYERRTERTNAKEMGLGG